MCQHAGSSGMIRRDEGLFKKLTFQPVLESIISRWQHANSRVLWRTQRAGTMSVRRRKPASEVGSYSDFRSGAIGGRMGDGYVADWDVITDGSSIRASDAARAWGQHPLGTSPLLGKGVFLVVRRHRWRSLGATVWLSGASALALQQGGVQGDQVVGATDADVLQVGDGAHREVGNVRRGRRVVWRADDLAQAAHARHARRLCHGRRQH